MSLQLATLMLSLLLAAPQESPEVAEVRHFMDARSDAWDKWDFDLLAAQFAEDAERWDARGHVTEGRQEIDQHCRDAFKSEESRQIKFVHKIDKIRMVDSNVAMVDASWSVKPLKGMEAAGDKNAKSNPPVKRQGQSLLILRKRDQSNWEIVSLRASFTITDQKDEDAD